MHRGLTTPRIRIYLGIYSTSTAAVWQLSEVLRVEPEPLGARVVTAIIGAVDTPIFTDSHPDAFQMPAGSYYKPIRQFIVDARDGKLQPPKTSHVDEAARQLVNDILGGVKGCAWRGVTSTECKWLSGWLPNWLLDMLNKWKRGISELRHYYPGNSA